MPAPVRVLFATWDGGGNIPPTVAAIRALVSRGHSVRALTEDTCAAELRAAGADVSRWRRAPNRSDRLRESDLTREWEVPDHDQIVVVRDRILLGPAEAYARDVLETLEAFDADVVVANDMLFGAIVGAEAARKPLAVFSPNLPLFPPPGSPAFGPGFFPPQNEDERVRARGDARDHGRFATAIQRDTRRPRHRSAIDGHGSRRRGGPHLDCLPARV